MQVDPLTVFIERCWARAFLVTAGEMTKVEAVDGLQRSAAESGLVNTVGQDAVQCIMAQCFWSVP